MTALYIVIPAGAALALGWLWYRFSLWGQNRKRP